MALTAADLIAFEERVAQAFLEKRIRAPIHLSGNNEDALIEIFKDVRPGDWVFSTWRSHFHALLKGIDPDWLFDEIGAGRSMFLCNANHKFICSAIVGGILPIALGVALAAQRLGLDEMVWVFVGDMASRTGLFHEFLQYADGHRLPVTVCIEDNGLSTNTPTRAVWGNDAAAYSTNVRVIRYEYERKWPHVGVGKNVQF